MCIKRKSLYKSIFFAFLLTAFLSSDFAFAFDGYLLAPIRKAEEKARLQRIEAEEKAEAIDDYYTTGKTYYQRGDYLGAVANFESLLNIEPNYEPAKLYLKCAIISHKLALEESKINSIKLKMADIIADYDDEVTRVEGLAMSYLLEQALLRCQAGNFAGAEYYYNLCYKLDPQNKERISWFVDATCELKDLYDVLDDCYKKIEEISEVESLD